MYLPSYLAMSETWATVGLEGARFNAAIGWFPEERIFKNNFIVDLSVSFKISQHLNDELDQSIDYMKLHEICAKQFAMEALLIETVAQHIIDEIVQAFMGICSVDITIKKVSPPVKAQIAASFVRLSFKK